MESLSCVPQFSIIIPTRNREETLEFTIRSCLNQTYDDFEVVVFDNAGGPATRDLIERLSSPRVRYFRGEHPLAMSLSWEVAIGYARGDFVTVVGSDDGLVPDALDCVARVLRHTPASVVRWEWASYYWPRSLDARRGTLRFLLPTTAVELDSLQVVDAIARLEPWYGRLPMLYNSFVHRNVLAEVRRRSGGRLLPALCPDIYSGFAVAMVVRSFVSLGRCLGIAGMSPAGTGENSTRGQEGNQITKEFYSLNSDASIALHPSLPPIAESISLAILDSYLKATENILGGEAILRISQRDLAREVLTDLLCTRTFPVQDLGKYCAVLRSHGIHDWDEASMVAEAQALVRERELPAHLGFQHNVFCVDLRLLNIEDIEGASRFLGCVLPNQEEISVDRSAAPTRVRAALRWLFHNFTPPFLRKLIERLRRDF